VNERVICKRECAFLETASERAEFPVPAGNDLSAKWPSEGMRATDRRDRQRYKAIPSRKAG